MKKYECSYAILQSNKLSIPVFSFYMDDMPISMLVAHARDCLTIYGLDFDEVLEWMMQHEAF